MNEQEIFAEALELNDPLERSTYLDRVCGGDRELRARLDRLLEAIQPGEDFMEEPFSILKNRDQAEDQTATLETNRESKGSVNRGSSGGSDYEVGASIGPYKLLQRLGEGGMGTVFLAEQKEPVKRRVAIKLIKEGMNSQAILNRFEAERQALSLMDHPNIARVLDAGQTDSGKPYFVMELVKGMPINAYCDAHRLDTRMRLELIKPICQAIQHAHQKGIVHRDIKPSNILVAEYDDVVTPKVIDFGIAKALYQPLTDATLYTQIGQIVGTLDYMSPEQAKLNQLDIDTRSDIYSLGVLLYELLTGTTPYDRGRLRKAALDELLRIIQDEPPPLPSQRLSSSETLAEVAASRATSPARLSSLVRGDLDWVVMKAMEKDRNRRYQSCTGLIEDIERYLSDLPVTARAPSKFYVLSKFARRNKVMVTASVLVFASMIAAIGASTWGLHHEHLAQQAEKRKAEVEHQAMLAAQAAQRQAEQITAEKTAALQREQEQRSYSEAITRFVRDDFLALTSVEGQLRFADIAGFPLNKDTTLKHLLDRATAKLDARSDLEPLTVATLRWMIGANYRGMGLYALAQQQLKQSAEIYTQALGAEHPDTLKARNEWALAEIRGGNRKEAISMLQNNLEIQQRPGLAETSQLLTTKNNLAIALQENGEFDAAIELFQQIKDARSELSDDNLDRIQSINNLADCYRDAGRIKEAISLHEDAYERRNRLLPKHDPRVIQSLANVALCYLIDGQLDKAMQLHDDASKRMNATIEAMHPDLLTLKSNIANGLQTAGKFKAALDLHAEVYEARRQQLGEKHSNTLSSLSDLAESYRLCGDIQRALKLQEQALAGRREVLPAGHLEIIHSLNNLAICCQIDERYLQALDWYNECIQTMRAVASNPDHPAILNVANNRALCQAKLGQYTDAIQSLKHIVEVRTASAPNHPLTLSSMHNLAECQILNGDVQAGLALLKKTLNERIKHLPANHPETLESLALLGKTECEQGQVETGMKRLFEVGDQVKTYPALWSVRDEIRFWLRGQQRLEQLREQIANDIALARQTLPAGEMSLALALAAIGKDQLEIGRFSEALPLIDESLQTCRSIASDHPRNAAIESLKARGLIDKAEQDQPGNREVLLRIERQLDAGYRIQVDRLKLSPTIDFYKQLQYTVEQLIRVTGLLQATDRQEMWRSADKKIQAALDAFGR